MKSITLLLSLISFSQLFGQKSDQFDILSIDKYHLAIKSNSTKEKVLVTDSVIYVFGQNFQVYGWIDNVDPKKVFLTGSGCSLTLPSNSVYVARIGRNTVTFSISVCRKRQGAYECHHFRVIHVNKIEEFEKLKG